MPYKDLDELELWASNDTIEWFPVPSIADAKAEDVCEKCIEKIKNLKKMTVTNGNRSD